MTKKPSTFSSLAPAETTEVYDTYWTFATERQAIFFARFRGEEPPWTPDPVLSRYKFTNAYRASDRVSQFLIRHIIYNADETTDDPNDIFFRIMLFKIFNRISTWELLEENVGHIHYEDYQYKTYDKIISNAMAKKKTVFSAAYIMPSGASSFGEAKKHRNYLKLLEQMIREDVPKKLADMEKMRDGFELLLTYPCIGDFLAYQFITDLNYSCLTNFSENEFVMPGPGAKSGIRKCFKHTGGLSDAEIIEEVTKRQQEEFEKRDLDFQTLWGRPLQLIDCQNLFCEVDKYARVMHPTISGVGKRARIKQKYKTKKKSRLEYWYPPKWGINDKIVVQEDTT